MAQESTTNKAAEAAALLLKEKEEFLENLPETATAEEKEAAEKAVSDAKVALEAVNKPDKNAGGKKVKVEFIASPTGKFNLAYNVGESALFDPKQVAELIEFKFCKEVK
jgi:hypothetical protein